MQMQRERDNLRKTLALINAWRVQPQRTEARLRQLLKSAGFEEADAQAMSEIVSAFGHSPA
jgi:tRNA C32,U32 (ribose-2'-O)-methylase TrmJ